MTPSPAPITAADEGAKAIRVDRFQADTHYALVKAWWAAQKFPIIPLTHLSSTGLIAVHNGKPAAAVWLYQTDSAICWLGWIVASPEIRHEERSAVMSALIDTAKDAAQEMGFQSMWMDIASEMLAARARAHGFTAGDQGMTTYICNLPRS